MAATFITTLVFMINESISNGASDTIQTRGMITSLWFLSENVAGYLGRYVYLAKISDLESLTN